MFFRKLRRHRRANLPAHLCTLGTKIVFTREFTPLTRLFKTQTPPFLPIPSSCHKYDGSVKFKFDSAEILPRYHFILSLNRFFLQFVQKVKDAAVEIIFEIMFLSFLIFYSILIIQRYIIICNFLSFLFYY